MSVEARRAQLAIAAAVALASAALGCAHPVPMDVSPVVRAALPADAGELQVARVVVTRDVLVHGAGADSWLVVELEVTAPKGAPLVALLPGARLELGGRALRVSAQGEGAAPANRRGLTGTPQALVVAAGSRAVVWLAFQGLPDALGDRAARVTLRVPVARAVAEPAAEVALPLATPDAEGPTWMPDPRASFRTHGFAFGIGVARLHLHGGAISALEFESLSAPVGPLLLRWRLGLLDGAVDAGEGTRGVRGWQAGVEAAWPVGRWWGHTYLGLAPTVGVLGLWARARGEGPSLAATRAAGPYGGLTLLFDRRGAYHGPFPVAPSDAPAPRFGFLVAYAPWLGGRAGSVLDLDGGAWLVSLWVGLR